MNKAAIELAIDWARFYQTLLYELPHLPALLATYSGGDVSQRSAVKVWLGELTAQGVLPVTLPKDRF